MMRISANLGFLLRDLPLPEAIGQARRLGFDAVECHWPYEVEPEAVAAALAETGLPMLGLNTRRGDAEAGEFGLAAVPGREAEARAFIDEAVAYAARIGCRAVHVMAGRAEGAAAFDTFARNLAHAVEAASPHGIAVLIEPLNHRDVPGYFLTGIDAALAAVDRTGLPVRIMFDCYHLAITDGDVIAAYARAAAHVGHVQFASVPDRAEPDHGDVDFCSVLPRIAALGYDGAFGAEYKPVSGSFAWLPELRAR